MAKLKIVVGTVYGGALDVAEQVSPLFEQAGYEVTIIEQPSLKDVVDDLPDLALFCVSTTGSGDFPGDFVPLVRELKSQSPSLVTLRYGVIALGDSSYGDTFCGSGRALDVILADLGGQRLGERLEIDAMETFMADDAAIPWVESWIKTQGLAT